MVTCAVRQYGYWGASQASTLAGTLVFLPWGDSEPWFRECNQHHALSRAGAHISSDQLDLFSQVLPQVPSSEWLIELHFQAVNLDSELFKAVYKVPQKPVWTITELSKHIKNWGSNNEAVRNTAKWSTVLSKPECGAIAQPWVQQSSETRLASLNTTHRFSGCTDLLCWLCIQTDKA